MPPLDENKRRRWLDKWVRLTAWHPQLRVLENEVYAFCRDYAKDPAVGRRLLAWGINGTGKTHCARAVHRWAQSGIALKMPLVQCDDRPKLASSQFFSWPAIVDGFKRGEWDVIDDAVEESLVVLDDVGAEHDPSGIGREKLCHILERRLNWWTIITSNVSPEGWEERFGRRIASRLLRNCTHVDLSDVEDWGAR